MAKDDTFIRLGLNSVVYVPQCFHSSVHGSLTIIVAKAGDDILVGGTKYAVEEFLQRLPKQYELGSTVYLPRTFMFFGLTVSQDTSETVTLSADDKMQNMELYQLSRVRRKQFSEPLNAVELSALQSINGFIGFMGIRVGPIAAFTCSYLQQSSNSYNLADLIKQSITLKFVTRMGTTSSFVRTTSKGNHLVAVLLFANVV